RMANERPTQLTSSEWVRRVWMWSLLDTGCTWVLRPKRRKAPEKITRSWSLWNGERPSSSVPCTGLPRRSRLSRECQSKGGSPEGAEAQAWPFAVDWTSGEQGVVRGAIVCRRVG